MISPVQKFHIILLDNADAYAKSNNLKNKANSFLFDRTNF